MTKGSLTGHKLHTGTQDAANGPLGKKTAGKLLFLLDTQ